MLLLDEVRLTRDAVRYGFATGKVAVLQARSLDSSAFERLLDAPTFAEQKRLLSETSYGRFIEGAETVEDVERGLDRALEEYYGFLDAAQLPEAVTRFFRIRYDFANLKAAVKAQLLGVGATELLVAHGTLSLERFARDLVDLPAPFGSLAAELGIGGGEAEATGRSSQRLSAIDVRIDKAFFAELVAAAKESRSRYLIEIARLLIDIANVKTIVRTHRAGIEPAACAGMLIDGGSTRADELTSIAELPGAEIAPALERKLGLAPIPQELFGHVEALDAYLDSVTAAETRKGRKMEAGPEPVIAYVLDREAEVAALRTLLIGGLNGTDRETLRRHVRTVG